MIVHVNELKFKTIIGILDFERVQKQDVVIDLAFEYNFNGEYIDYSLVVQLIKETMHKEQFLLIEDAILTISKKLRTIFPNILWCDLTIAKPSILADCKVSVSLKS